MNRRVAAIDIGTNSVLLLVAEERGGELVPVVERATITRLGQGVDKTRALAPEAIARTLACLEEYGNELRAAGASIVDAVGTSAMRDAAGGEAFVARAKELLGVAPRVISGDEEARLTFAGALSGLRVDEARAVVVDIGGGSTEIISRAGGVSLNVGSVRLTERHVKSDPPSDAEIEAARADIREALDAAPPIPPSARVVAVAGTATTIAAFARNISPYDASKVHGAALSAREVHDALASLAKMTLAERKRAAGIDAGRADVIVCGATILEEVLSRFGAADVTISDRGVRWGLALELVKLS